MVIVNGKQGSVRIRGQETLYLHTQPRKLTLDHTPDDPIMACWMSYRYLRASSGIEHRFRLLQALLEEGIAKAGRRHQVYGSREKSLERLPQTEICLCILFRGKIAQINQKIQVVNLQAVVTGRSRSKQVQPPYAESTADGLDFAIALLDFLQHGVMMRIR